MPKDAAEARLGKAGLKNAIFLFFAVSVGLLVGVRTLPQLKGADFPDFYCAARILLDGQARHLYDPAVQYRYQAAYAGRVGTLYIHPPFEAVVFLTVAWLPLRYAYLLWSAMNIVLLAAAVRQLTKEVQSPWDWPIIFAASLTFVPVLLCLQQGQDSLLLLFLLTLAFSNLRQKRDFSAGCWLALGLFKFQIALPLALILFCRELKNRRWRFAGGFAAVGCCLSALSAAICSKSVFTTYPAFLIYLPSQHFAGIVPRAMPNLRGLVNLLIGSHDAPRATIAVALLSGAFLLWTVLMFSRSFPTQDFELLLATATLCALLVSYHLNPHDLTLALVPILLLHSNVFVFRRSQSSFMQSKSPEDWVLLTVITFLLLPPIHAFALAKNLYALMALPLLLLFFLASKKAPMRRA